MSKWLPGVVAGYMLVFAAQAAETPTYNRIHFQVSASESIGNDRMRAVLGITDDDSDAAQLADRINQTMAWGLGQAKGETGVEVRSGGYNTHPIYDKSHISGWRASQDLILTSGDFSRVGTLIGKLQSRLQLRSVEFYVDEPTRDVAEAGLIERALADYKQRAEQIRKHLGKPGYRIVDLHVQTEGAPIIMKSAMRTEAMSSMAAVAPPALEGGESEVRVSVSGTIELTE